MIDIKTGPNDYVKYSLDSEIASTYELRDEPEGWNDHQIEFTRHKDYHGIMTSFTGDLSFFGGARDYIINDFKALGVNSKMKLNRYVLREVNDVVKWDLDYVGIVDYSTYSDKDKVFKVRFNSNELEELLKTRENDEFELDRKTDINGNAINSLQTDLTSIEGIDLLIENKMDIKKDLSHDEGPPSYWSRGGGEVQLLTLVEGEYQTAVLELLTDTNTRISTPDTADPNADPASQMFFVDSTDPNVDVDTLLSVSFSFKVDMDIIRRDVNHNFGRRRFELVVVRFEYDDVGLVYNIVDEILINWVESANSYTSVNLQGDGQYTFEDIAYNQGLALMIKSYFQDDFWNPIPKIFDATVREYSINISTISTKTVTNDCEFLFAHDVLQRLTEILTGDPRKFVSRIFGRKESGYFEDGDYGLVGIISGYWIRKFNENFPLYKPMKVSYEDIIDSLNSVFNTGLGIEVIDGAQKIVVEDLKYFYQNNVVVKLEEGIYEDEYKPIKNDWFSTLEFGYEQGGEYDDALGLDEPNVETSWITPINRNKQKYRKLSRVRADDIGAELLRRKPASLYPSEDTSNDDNNWFLDLKRVGNNKFEQVEWFDRLEQKPSGLSYAESFKSMLFTPLRCLFRHGWIIRGGMNEVINTQKYITVNSSKTNSTLGMFFKGDTRERLEGEDILVRELDTPRVKPEQVTLKHPISEDLLKLIRGKTVVQYQEQEVAIPNYYFKFEWTNNNGQKERGYLTGLNTAENEFTFILANENIV